MLRLPYIVQTVPCTYEGAGKRKKTKLNVSYTNEGEKIQFLRLQIKKERGTTGMQSMKEEEEEAFFHFGWNLIYFCYCVQ